MTEKRDGKSNLIKDLSSSGTLDVEITSRDLGKNEYLQERMKSIGKDLAPAGHTYLGSLCTHIYVSQLSREASIVNQIVGMENVAEAVASFAVSDLALKARECFNPEFKQKTRNKLDKR